MLGCPGAFERKFTWAPHCLFPGRLHFFDEQEAREDLEGQDKQT